MISLWWSFTLIVIGVAGIALAYRSQSKLGPTIGIAAQFLWVAYAVATQQWWFLVSAFLYGGTHAYGLVKRHRAAPDET
ncbi:hypothetical protein GCM10007304_17780 [Rhodococcoides trifolii]|uniref:Uncharacterized protein n=1 Tax=Rhodococcoides trifolii TaxID=908250 RepID=A0A917CZU7_9NOCA|nr:hypothetical protein [Rhodococcus trifolii]GGG04070.1 hypothetical protein GCM10007304_17780 [Rhodococcus trifolii]